MIAAVRAGAAIDKYRRISLVAVFVLANLIMAAMIAAGLADSWLLWSAPLWALLYRHAMRHERPPRRDACDMRSQVHLSPIE
jgi:hypothetical protein